MNATINASDYIVIRDSQFQFPVLAADVERAGKSQPELKALDGEQYGAWCNEVSMDRSHGDVGSQGCIDFCEELIEAGAKVWDIG